MYYEEVKGWTPEEKVNAGLNAFALLIEAFRYIWDDDHIVVLDMPMLNTRQGWRQRSWEWSAGPSNGGEKNMI